MKFKIKNVRSRLKRINGKELEPGEEKVFDLEEEDVSNLGLALRAEKVEEFECDECEKAFDTKRGLKVHKAQHEKKEKDKEVNDNGSA